MKVICLAGAEIELHPNGLTVSRYPHGEVRALPQDDADYLSRAEELGYGDNAALMSREHEIVHHLLAHWLGLPASPTLHAVAGGKVWEHWQKEEAAVLAIQALARQLNISLGELSDRR